MAERYTNNVRTTLSAGINSSTTTIPFTSVTGVPTTGEFAFIIDNEIFKGLSVSGSNITVAARGQEGTAAAAHSSGASIFLVLTARALQALTPYSAANQLLYGNSSNDAVALAAATPNTLLHGGTPPAMSAVVAGDLSLPWSTFTLTNIVQGSALAGFAAVYARYVRLNKITILEGAWQISNAAGATGGWGIWLEIPYSALGIVPAAALFAPYAYPVGELSLYLFGSGIVYTGQALWNASGYLAGYTSGNSLFMGGGGPAYTLVANDIISCRITYENQ